MALASIMILACACTLVVLVYICYTASERNRLNMLDWQNGGLWYIIIPWLYEISAFIFPDTRMIDAGIRPRWELLVACPHIRHAAARAIIANQVVRPPHTPALW